jgi:hypothetical protein
MVDPPFWIHDIAKSAIDNKFINVFEEIENRFG